MSKIVCFFITNHQKNFKITLWSSKMVRRRRCFTFCTFTYSIKSKRFISLFSSGLQEISCVCNIIYVIILRENDGQIETPILFTVHVQNCSENLGSVIEDLSMNKYVQCLFQNYLEDDFDQNRGARHLFEGMAQR